MRFPLSFALMAAPVLLSEGRAEASDVVATYKVGVAYDMIYEASENGWGRVEYRFKNGTFSPSYIVVAPDGRGLRVFMHNGRRLVAEARDYGAWMERLTGMRIVPAKPTQELFAKAGEERVGSWSGTAYTIAQGCGRWRHLVVMHGTGRAVLGRVFRATLLPGILAKQHPNPCELQAVDLIGSGTLLRLDDWVLDRLEVRRIDPSRFKLPGPVLTRAQLFALTGTVTPLRASPAGK